MSEHKLTRKDEVLAAVAMGAKIEKVDARGGLLRLVSDGREIPAWQTALTSAVRALEQRP